MREDPATRARALGAKAKAAGNAPRTLVVYRDWWLVTKAGAAVPVEVFVHPRLSQAEVLRHFYPGAQVEALY